MRTTNIKIEVLKEEPDSFYQVYICLAVGLGQKDECDALAKELRQSVQKTLLVLHALSDEHNGVLGAKSILQQSECTICQQALAKLR